MYKAYSELNKIWSEYVMYAYAGDMSVDEALDTAAQLGNDAINNA